MVAAEDQDVTSDFNGDGVVNFADFLEFVGQFGTRQNDGRYDAKYDLDSDVRLIWRFSHLWQQLWQRGTYT